MKVIARLGVGYILKLYGEEIAITRKGLDELLKTNPNLEVKFEA